MNEGYEQSPAVFEGDILSLDEPKFEWSQQQVLGKRFRLCNQHHSVSLWDLLQF